MQAETIDVSGETAAPRRVRLLGGEMDLVTPEEVLAFTARRVAAGGRAIVANHNQHSLYLLKRGTPGFADFYARADVIEIDSTPLIFWGRLLGRGTRRAHRCTYLDWREAFWREAVIRGWRVFYLGGAPGVAEAGAEALRRRWPGAAIETRDGYFDAESGSVDNAEALARIAAFAPHVLMVGMGMPRQEQWIGRNLDHLPACVIFPVGAAFDYEAGVQPTPPRWIGRLGLEWLYRLVANPRRMFVRYCIEPWFLIPAALGDLFGGGRERSRPTPR